MGRRGKSSRGRAEGRVRGRIRERAQKRPGRGGGAGPKKSTFDVRAIEGYAERLSDRIGGTSGLAGAASGFAGSRLAHRIADSDPVGEEEDFMTEVREHLDLIDERLQRLEDEMHQLRGVEGLADVTEPSVSSDPQSDQ